MKTSPTQRSLKRLRESGYTCQVVEKWNPFAKIRQDLFGWIDIVAVHENYGIAGVQTTTAKNMAARLKKAEGNHALLCWLQGGNGAHLILHGWKKTKLGWECVSRDVRTEDIL